MMFPGWGMGGWMMISFGFVVLLFLVGIVVALVALSRRTGRNGPTATPTVQQRDTTEQRPTPSNRNGMPTRASPASKAATPSSWAATRVTRMGSPSRSMWPLGLRRHLSRKRLRIVGTRPRSAAIRPAGQQHRSAAP